jgi:hypothetical protein
MEADKSVFNDTKFEAMLDKYRVVDPEIPCKSGNKIVKICLNTNCKMVLQCALQPCNH